MWNAISKTLLCRIVLCAGLCTGSAAAGERIEALEPHMGTMFRIVVYANDANRAHDAIRAAFARVADLDNRLSDYRTDSELNRVSRMAAGHDIPISDDLFVVLRASQSLADSTDGAFDVTIAPLVRLWRKARKTKQLPAAEDIAEALRVTGYQFMHLGEHSVRFDRPGMQLDLGAIAKGYAADEALRLLAGRGFPMALVAASGDLAMGDPPPGQAGWEIGVDSMNSSNESFTRKLQLRNAAVSTSGDTEQYVEINGVRYSHIVNKATGKGLTGRIGVTVIANKGMDADSLATATSVLTEQRGPAAGIALLESRGARGLIVTESGGQRAEFQTSHGL